MYIIILSLLLSIDLISIKNLLSPFYIIIILFYITYGTKSILKKLRLIILMTNQFSLSIYLLIIQVALLVLEISKD